MTRAALCLVLIVVAGLAWAEAPQWKLHTYLEDGFQVEFSGDVGVSPAPLDDRDRAEIVRATNYVQNAEDFAYIVVSGLFKHGPDFAKGKDGSFSGAKCGSILSDEPVPSAKGQAREVRGTDCQDGTWRVEARYYESGPWFYQVIAVFKKDAGDASAARHFLQSFKLAD